MPIGDDDALFGVTAGAEGALRPAAKGPVDKGPVDKTFRAFAPEQDLLLPPSLNEWLPCDHLARFVAELVDEHLDLSRIHQAFTEGRGAPPYDPRLMVRILLYGYTTGIRSSRKLEAACTGLPRVFRTADLMVSTLPDAGFGARS